MPQKDDFQRGVGWGNDEKNCGGELVCSPEQYSMDKRENGGQQGAAKK